MQPGDVIVGDDDGVIVIPPALFAEVVNDAYEQELQDGWVFDQVREGNPVKGLFPPTGEWKERYLQWRDEQDGGAQ